MLGGSFAAEVLKLRKRPATWVCAFVVIFGIVTLTYLLSYVFLRFLPTGSDPQARAGLEQLRRTLYPELFAYQTINWLAGTFGVVVATVLGALSTGSEYGLGTLKSVLTQRPARLTVLFGKLLALAVVLLAIAAPTFLTAAAASLAIALFDGQGVRWPPVGDPFRAIAASWLVLAAYCAYGVALAVIFRSTIVSLVVGLVYVLLVEGAVTTFASFFSPLRTVARFLIGGNVNSLAVSFGPTLQVAGAPQPVVGAGQATLVIIAYLASFVLLATFFFRRRDVT